MAVVDITITDGTGNVGDVIVGWAVNESTTPFNPSETAENTGSVSFAAKTQDDSVFLVDDDVTFTHSALGEISGIVGDISITDDVVSGSISKLLMLLDVERNMPPTSTLPIGTIITNYVAEVTDQISVVYSGSVNPSHSFPGWNGNVWDSINELCALNGLEVVISGSVLTVRDMGSQTVEIDDTTALSRSISTRAAGLYVDVVYQQSELIASDSTYKYNYSENPSLETNATDWAATKNAYGTITSGRVNN